MTAITHPKVFVTHRFPALGWFVLLHLLLSLGLVRVLTHPTTMFSSGPAPTPSVASALFSQSANGKAFAPKASLARVRASDLFRAERQEVCERQLILNEEWLTGSALIHAAHNDVYAYALAWDMPDLAARAFRMAQVIDLAAICEV